MKKFRYENRVAIVTGASSGIGREISKILVEKYGCTVFGVARNFRRLDVVRSELGSERFLCCAMDASDKKSWEKLSVYFENSDTSPDILINCAGILPKFSSVENEDVNVTELAMSVNYFSAVYGCNYMMKQINDGGMVINVSSASALCPFAGVASYSASKAALQRYTECLSREEKRLSVSSVMPGFVKTDIMKNQNINEKEQKTVERFSADPYKVAKKILKKAAKRKKRIIVGKDGHFMSILYRLFPNFAPWFFTKVIKKSHMVIFNDI